MHVTCVKPANGCMPCAAIPVCGQREADWSTSLCLLFVSGFVGRMHRCTCAQRTSEDMRKRTCTHTLVHTAVAISQTGPVRFVVTMIGVRTSTSASASVRCCQEASRSGSGC